VVVQIFLASSNSSGLFPKEGTTLYLLISRWFVVCKAYGSPQLTHTPITAEEINCSQQKTKALITQHPWCHGELLKYILINPPTSYLVVYLVSSPCLPLSPRIKIASQIVKPATKWTFLMCSTGCTKQLTWTPTNSISRYTEPNPALQKLGKRLACFTAVEFSQTTKTNH